MTALPQSTPGDRREDRAQAVADAVAAVYGQAELVLIATIAAVARRVASDVMLPAVARRKVTQTARTVFDAAATRAHTALGSTLASAPHTALLAQLLDQAADTATVSALEALTAALPDPATPTGPPGSTVSLSRIRDVQKTLDDFAALGVVGFVDRAGRRWDLTSYVEMATRTSVSNAWDDLHTAALVRAGLDLVRVSTYSLEGSCPQCRPWLGRVLSLTGATPGHPTLAQAKAAGFRHPNCRCFWTPLATAAAADAVDPAGLALAAHAYAAAQHQRALFRDVRQARRRAHAAITPAARSTARRNLATARAALDAHPRRAR